MKRSILFVLILSLWLLLSGLSLGVTPETTDPYRVYGDYYEALGGIDKVERVKNIYYEAGLTYSGLQGSYKEWIDVTGLRWADDMDLKVFRQRNGYNGKIAWSADTNGKMMVQKDEVSKKKRQIRKLMEKRVFLDPTSPFFKLTYLGKEKIGQTECHKVKISNTINGDELIEYFNTKTGLKEKSENIEADGSQQTIYSDYRPTEGILRPFKQEVTILPAGQKLVFTIKEFRINKVQPSSVFDPPKKDVADFAFANGKSAENIAFAFIEKHIYVNITIQGRSSLWVLDSGAGISVMDEAFAREIGLQPTGNMTGQGAGNPVEISFVTMPPYQLPGVGFQAQKIGCLELRPMFRKVMGFEIDGILGYDFLSRLVTRIDYAVEKISFYHPKHFNYSGEGRVLATPIRDNFFSLPLTIDGKYKGLWRLDLGAGDESFHYPFAKEQGFLKRPGIQTLSRGAGGEILERTVRFDSMEVAGYKIKKPLISFPAKPVKGSFSEKEFMGNAGNTLFRHFVLYLDYHKQHVILEKGRNFGKDFPENRSGLSLLLNGNRRIMIYYIVPGSPAEKAGFLKGDIIEAIAGVDRSQYDSLVNIRGLFRSPSGTRFKIHIDRQGTPKTIPITLKNLL